jgi:hypothetical protein
MVVVALGEPGVPVTCCAEAIGTATMPIMHTTARSLTSVLTFFISTVSFQDTNISGSH